MHKATVLVIGAGPAGAITAMLLAPFHPVTLIERRLDDGRKQIGESLPSAARTLLLDMDLLDAFLAEGHTPWYGSRSVWGTPEPATHDFLWDPHGLGWHLDRARFDAWLRREAVLRGATLMQPATVERITRTDMWRVRTRSASGSRDLSASLLIDASGRGAPVARQLGAQRIVHDRLVAVYVHGKDTWSETPAMTLVEAVEEGYWYTAPTPNGGRVLAFHTDADLPMLRVLCTPVALLEQAYRTREIARTLTLAGFQVEGQRRATTAHSTSLVPCTGEGWLATGDAALAFDPLASQGLLNALFTGLAAAEAVSRYLAGERRALQEYVRTIAGIRRAYCRNHADFYRAEGRWPCAPFWLRRRRV